MPYLQSHRCGDEFATIPQTGCRLDRKNIGETGNNECYPTDQIVNQLEI